MKAYSKHMAEQAAWAMRKRRVGLGMKQAEAAARAGIALGTLQKFEQGGGISLERFFKLCFIYRMEHQIMASIEERDGWGVEEIRRAETKRIVR